MNSSSQASNLNIFMITESLCKGGKERRILELLRYLNSHYPVKVRLVLLRDRIEYEEIHKLKNVSIHILKRRIKKDPRIFSQVYRLCREFKPDLIHSWGSMPSIYTFAIAGILRIPFLNGMITNAICKPFSSHWIRSKITFPFSNLILANSYAGLEAFKVKPKKGRVIHNGFNPDRLKIEQEAQTIRKKYQIETEYAIAMIGAFHPRKDYKTFLDTARTVLAMRKDVTFLAIGNGKEMENLKAKYKAFDRIRFTGNIMDIESLINSITLGVLLTNPYVHHEGISNALMEMMAFGKPVIASCGGGNAELIQDGKSGVILEENSVHNLSLNIVKLLNTKSLRDEIGSNARRRIEELFSIKSMSEEMYQLYQTLKK